jgi:hypothetical protein
MKKFLFAMLLSLSASAVLVTTSAAQDRGDSRDLRRDNPTPVAGQAVSPTPEMWFYEQERTRYEDPKAAVRRKAEFRSTQRQNRLASCKWFGIDNSRPTASPTPVTGTYSPTWISNTPDPYRWSGVGGSPLVVRPFDRY